ncbi:MAG: sigma-54-dependent transcriptional regulator [Bacteriovoracia bacterium]
MKRILLVDDDPQALDSMARILEIAGHAVERAVDGQEALEKVQASRTFPYHAVISDVRMPRLGGLEFLKAITICAREVPVILMTAFGQVEDAVWAMKLGAVDFLTKPFKRQALLDAVESATRGLKVENVAAVGASPLDRITGQSPAISELKRLVTQVAQAELTVLIFGESGTGKELVAQSIHRLGTRADRPFIALNCAAIPEHLMESELFGHEKGAFTGAAAARPGLFESADGGTLFLDEIGDMPLSLQAKLLRAIQEGEVRRVGATIAQKVNVRLLAATHRDLKAMVQAGTFRQDLLFRLDVIEIQTPALRARTEDLPTLASSFIEAANQRHGKAVRGISPEAMAVLTRHPWPGNVRELANVIERAVVLAQTQELQPEDLPSHLRAQPGEAVRGEDIRVPFGTPLWEVEELLIRKTLEATEGDKNMAAKILGVNSRTIYRKLEKQPREQKPEN